jgi:hypothetical protein
MDMKKAIQSFDKKGNTVERIDEIEGFETRINPNQRVAMTDFQSHTPINEKTVNEIKHHVNNTAPEYYKGKTIQVFDMLDEFLTQEAVSGFYVGNVIKYVVRFRGKNGREDLLKARDYLNKLIEATA